MLDAALEYIKTTSKRADKYLFAVFILNQPPFPASGFDTAVFRYHGGVQAEAVRPARLFEECLRPRLPRVHRQHRRARATGDEPQIEQQVYLTESVYQVVLQTSIPAQIRQL